MELTTQGRNAGFHRPMGGHELTPSQQAAVDYFFNQLSFTDQLFFNQAMPSDKAAIAVKRAYASHIMNFTEAQIDIGFAGYRMAKQSGSEQYTSIDAAIGYIKRNGQPPEDTKPVEHCARAGMYTPFVPDRALPDKAAEERSRIGYEKFREQFGDWLEGGA